MRVNTFFLLISSSLMIRNSLALVSMHFKCRARVYPRSTIERYPVPDDKVSWSVEYKHYNPPNYTAPFVHGKPWADPPINTPNFQPKWNNIDGKISRVSYTGKYEIVDGYPRNPIGRTGLIGRGVLGRWGPNHAADPVVTRWKRLNPETIDLENLGPRSNKPILQFVAIKRGDTGEWALPGGMVDPGEKVTATAVREFQEEATNSLEKSNEEKEAWQKRFEEFFKGGDEVYRGYVDDPRNTDNAWMETAAYNFHDESGAVVGGLELHAGDDAVGARWVDITPDLNLYASHKDIVQAVLKRHTR